MKKKQFVLMALTAFVVFAGCGNGNEGNAPTLAPTGTLAPTEGTPTLAPTVTLAPTSTPVPTLAPTATPTLTPVIPDKVEIVSVEEVQENVIAVTLNTMSTEVDVTSISVKKNLVSWSSLTKKTLNFDSKTGVISKNADGYTVITYSMPNTSKFSNLEDAVRIADNYLSWQMDHGGWDKKTEQQAASPWNGKDKKSKFSGWVSKSGEALGQGTFSGTRAKHRFPLDESLVQYFIQAIGGIIFSDIQIDMQHRTLHPIFFQLLNS